MDIRKTSSNGNITIFLAGKFTFDSRAAFHEAALNPGPEITSITIDFKDLEYMDSSSVGMLLILHENSQRRGIHVTAINVAGNIRPLFEQSALGRLFEVA